MIILVKYRPFEKYFFFIIPSPLQDVTQELSIDKSNYLERVFSLLYNYDRDDAIIFFNGQDTGVKTDILHFQLFFRTEGQKKTNSMLAIERCTQTELINIFGQIKVYYVQDYPIPHFRIEDKGENSIESITKVLIRIIETLKDGENSIPYHLVITNRGKMIYIIPRLSESEIQKKLIEKIEQKEKEKNEKEKEKAEKDDKDDKEKEEKKEKDVEKEKEDKKEEKEEKKEKEEQKEGKEGKNENEKEKELNIKRKQQRTLKERIDYLNDSELNDLFCIGQGAYELSGNATTWDCDTFKEITVERFEKFLQNFKLEEKLIQKLKEKIINLFY